MPCIRLVAWNTDAETRSVATSNRKRTYSKHQLLTHILMAGYNCRETPKVSALGIGLLALTIILEVAGATSMKLSNNFANLVPSVLLFVFYGSSFTLFTFALKHWPLSIAYGVIHFFVISASHIQKLPSLQCNLSLPGCLTSILVPTLI